MKRVSLLVAALALTAGGLSAQSADDIIARYLRAVGGAQRIAAVQTLRRVGTFYGGGGFEAAVTQENKRPNRVRSHLTIQGMTLIQAYDGRTGWRVNPFQGKKDAEAMGEDEVKSIVEEAEFDDALFDYKAKGNTVAYLGTDQIEGSQVYKLQLTAADNGDVRTYYIDADNNVPIKLEIRRTVRGAEQELEFVYGDYKEVNGWYLPFAVEVGPKGGPAAQRNKLAWQRIEANPVIPDSRFAMPAPGTPVEAGEQAAAPAPAPPARAPAPARVPARAPAPAAPAVVDSETFAGLGARNIGSAAMSGRIAALAAVHEGDRLTLYVGAASGGVWKSQNGGTTFKPVFDKEPVQSIGAITIDPTNPKIVWVGTGESWVRNSVSIGDGVYKSTDGGETWTNMGLRESERISQILVDSTNPNTVYVCVPGKLWSDSDERGVYKTTDGG
ncbi:MAG TPA: hypothetical protein VKP10_10490, partial [Gemmatimonadales bacterium]|nr:hypothetical protein [Gemmatimonadales bacterium]